MTLVLYNCCLFGNIENRSTSERIFTKLKASYLEYCLFHNMRLTLNTNHGVDGIVVSEGLI